MLAGLFAGPPNPNRPNWFHRGGVAPGRVLLETTGQPVKTIAYECGFGDAHRMRAVFRRRLGLSPQEYRTHFLEPAARSAQS